MMLMSMTAGAMCLNKVAPILPVLIRGMGLSGEGEAGLLISVFVFSGIFLALPSGMIITKLGYYRTGIMALGATLLGSVIGGLNPGYALMLVSRVIEGIGLILLMTVGPAATGAVFSDAKRGSAMGLLMCFMAFGQIAMFNLTPRIVGDSNWEIVWWITSIYAAVFLVIWVFTLGNLDAALAIEVPAAGEPGMTFESRKASLLPKAVLLNKGVWLIGLTLLLYLIAEQGVMGFLATYLNKERGLGLDVASSMLSIAPLVGIPVGIIVGILSDKMGSRKRPLGVLMLASAVTYALMPTFSTALYLVLIVLFGIAVMGIVGLCFSAVTELVEPQYGGVAVGMLNTFQWVGIFLSGSLVGVLIQEFGWTMTFYILVPVTVIGAICAFITPKLR
jgi:MFS family permease